MSPTAGSRRGKGFVAGIEYGFEEEIVTRIVDLPTVHNAAVGHDAGMASGALRNRQTQALRGRDPAPAEDGSVFLRVAS